MAKVNQHLDKRHTRTINFVEKHVSKNEKILDLGTPNLLSKRLNEVGFQVSNTKGENLDIDFDLYTNTDADVITAFEIFEHMFAPFNILNNLKTNKLIASIPMKLWFTDAYWNEKDDWDKHYHEFEKKQFDFLLEKTGWRIIDSEIWKSGDWKKIGVRPLLRHITPRYYMVYCERNS